MASSADFIEFLKDQLRGLGHVTSRRMFSGAGIYCDGVIFALLLRDTLYFKVDDGNRAAYEAEGLKPFSYQAKGRTMEIKAYWRVPERLLDDPDEMVEWARAALAAGQRAEAKKKPQAASPSPRKALRGPRVRGAAIPSVGESGRPSPDPSPRLDAVRERRSYTGHTGAWVPSGTGGRDQCAGVSDRRAAWRT